RRALLPRCLAGPARRSRRARGSAPALPRLGGRHDEGADGVDVGRARLGDVAGDDLSWATYRPASCPPSTEEIWPGIHAPWSEHKETTIQGMSGPSPARPSGTFSAMTLSHGAPRGMTRVRSVSTKPGQMVL